MEKKIKSSNRLNDITVIQSDTIVEVKIYFKDDTYKQIIINRKHLSKAKNGSIIGDIATILENHDNRAVDRVTIDEYTCTPNYPNGGLAINLHLCAGKKMKNGEVVKEYSKERICLYEAKYLASVPKNKITTYFP